MAGSAVGWVPRSRRHYRSSLSDRGSGHVLPAAFAASASVRVSVRRDLVRARRHAAVAEQPPDGALRDELDAVAGPLHAPIFPGTPTDRFRAGCARSRSDSAHWRAVDDPAMRRAGGRLRDLPEPQRAGDRPRGGTVCRRAAGWLSANRSGARSSARLQARRSDDVRRGDDVVASAGASAGTTRSGRFQPLLAGRDLLLASRTSVEAPLALQHLSGPAGIGADHCRSRSPHARVGIRRRDVDRELCHCHRAAWTALPPSVHARPALAALSGEVHPHGNLPADHLRGDRRR